ncbi:MAG: hypothetical protein ACLFUP_06765, partial [Desulfobacteraceae bacterium]
MKANHPSRSSLFRFMLCFAVFASWLTAPCRIAEADGPAEITYLRSGSGVIRLGLKQDKEDGFVCTSCKDLLKVTLDQEEVPHEITTAEAEAALAAPFSGLRDGRHKAAASAQDANGGMAAETEALFIVDTRPPKLKLIEPDENLLQPTQTTFLVRCRDEGSGVSPDPEESGLSIKINGIDADWRLDRFKGDPVFVVSHLAPGWEPGENVSFSMSLGDRAGNRSELNRTFEVETSEDEWELESINCIQGDGKVEAVEVLRSIPYPLRTAVHAIAFDRDLSPVIFPMELASLEGRPMDEDVFNALEVETTHPCLRVERLERPPEASSQGFRVSQVHLPDGREPIGFITIRHPERVVFDYDLECNGGKARAEVKDMTATGTVKSYKVPVSLQTEVSCSEEVVVEDGVLTYRFSLSGPCRLDTAKSWLAVGGKRRWLSCEGQGVYQASMGLSEGLHVYTAHLTSELLEWEEAYGGEISNDGRSLYKTGEVFVRLDTPKIKDFHYDRENECFKAVVSDQGTAPEDLVLNLAVSQAGELDPRLDPESGAMLATFPIPLGVRAARLRVTDMAGQTAEAACRVFGVTPPAQPAAGPDHPFEAKVKQGSSSIGGGGIIRSNLRVTRQYLGEYKNGREAVVLCTHPPSPAPKNHPLAECLERAYALYGAVSVPKSTFGSSLALDSSPSPAPNPALTKAVEDCRRKYPPGSSAGWTYYPEPRCSKRWMDTLPPRIRDSVFSPATRQITALIDDHGMPLSELSIGYRIRPKAPDRTCYWEETPFSYDTATGLFIGEVPFPPDLEIFKAEITARDAAGNRTRKWLDVKAPIRPPDVHLEVLETGAAAYPSGVCFDASGIDHRKTKAWVDEQQVALSGVRYGERTEPDQIEFGAVTEEGRHTARLEVVDFAGLASEASAEFEVSIPPKIRDFKYLPRSVQNAGAPAFSALIKDAGGDLDIEGIELLVDGEPLDRDRLFYDPASGYFAADGPLHKGPDRHSAELTAVDAKGHSDQALIVFTPGERIEVQDQARKGVAIEEVTVWELEDHNGDGRANPGETVRLFIRLLNSGPAGLVDATARLVSHEPDMTLERDEESYGDLEPGETAAPPRGFDVGIDKGFLDTRFGDPYEARFTLEVADKSGDARLLDFHLPVYRPSLPLHAPESQSRSSLENPSASEVRLSLDPLPFSTEETKIEVTGTALSTASDIDRVVVRVNGTPHEAVRHPGSRTFSVIVPLDMGDNLI